MFDLSATLWAQPSPHRIALTAPAKPVRLAGCARMTVRRATSDEIGGSCEGQLGLSVWPLARGAPALPARHRLQSLPGISVPTFPSCGGRHWRAVYLVELDHVRNKRPSLTPAPRSAHELTVGRTRCAWLLENEPTRHPKPYGGGEGTRPLRPGRTE